MNIQETLRIAIQKGLQEIYNVGIDNVEFQATRKDFEGDITIVVFPFLKVIKTNPAQLASSLGDFLKDNIPEIKDFNVVQGFLNLVLSDSYFLNNFREIYSTSNYGYFPLLKNTKSVMVEYSSPNTNKPLHLGHIRNNLLGYSVSEILKASGKKVYKTQIINDRGIHICKSMLAWQRYGNDETPDSTGIKGDKLVGNYYVRFDQEYKKEVEVLVAKGLSEEEAKKQAPILLEAQEMLVKWEAGDAEVVALWKKMNHWVYKGFEQTYKNLGVDFDNLYYESETYLLGKDIVADG
ncbi:MAG: arginine--tRNA ligase, partial [Flavobacteriaceae bacterium]|nr:arginine--tRNA ligase [Flavobacteriaceae bacterium]